MRHSNVPSRDLGSSAYEATDTRQANRKGTVAAKNQRPCCQLREARPIGKVKKENDLDGHYEADMLLEEVLKSDRSCESYVELATLASQASKHY